MLLAAGCGGEEPGLPSDLAAQLGQRSDAAASALKARRYCDARESALALQTRTITAVNAGRVPAELQEELLGFVNALVDGVTCTPPAAADGALEEAQDLSDWLRDRSG